MNQVLDNITPSNNSTPNVPSNGPATAPPTLSLSCNLFTACAAILDYMNSQNSIQAANSTLEEDISNAERKLTEDFNNSENARFAAGKAGKKEKEELKGHYVTQQPSFWDKFIENVGNNPGTGGVPNTQEDVPHRTWIKGSSEFDTNASNIEYQLQHFSGSSREQQELTAIFNEQTNKEQAEIKTMDGNNTVMSNSISQLAQGIQGLMATFGAINSQEGNMARLATAV